LLDEENDRVVDRCIVVGVEPKALVVEITGGKAVLDEHGAPPVRWAQVKDDISPQQIFASQRGSDKDRALIAKYCLQDCDLVMELFQKLDVLNNAIAKGADFFITADFKYHQFFDAEGKIVIADIGHFESEQFTTELFFSLLKEKFTTFAVHFSKIKTNPINYFKA
jgi:putative NIF3 family GTP cyclohydrolase 1 type 2